MSLADNDRWLLSYADEAAHAHYWTECISDLDSTPLPLARGYQNQYLEAVGMPANLMEVMAITQIFEKRVVRDALTAMATRYGEAEIARTLARFTAADQEVYARTLTEYGDRITFLADAESS